MFVNYDEYLNDSNPVLELKLDWADEVVTIQLFPQVAPVSVENFLKLTRDNFYNGLIFHRIIKGFMCQGGDPTGSGMGGSDENIVGEFASNGFQQNNLSHNKGVISMARSMDFNSASSQFFIMHRDVSQLDGDYAAFGVVTSGFDVIERLAAVDTNPMDKPNVDQVIEYIKIVKE